MSVLTAILAKWHPVILHRSSHFTKLLVRHLHLSSNHAGPESLEGLLYNKYHVVGAKQVVREVSQSCIICRKIYARTATQLMRQLPSTWVNLGIPFQEVGTDFTGPILLRQGYTRKPHNQGIHMPLCLYGNQGSSPGTRHRSHY